MAATVLKGGVHLTQGVRNPDVFRDIITRDEKMISLFGYVEAVAGSGQPILITGETGVGKELFARSIHASSNLKGRYVVVNVAGLDDNVFSDTLFGHVKGAFTGANRSRKGLIEQAEGGTLFLDEIGELSISSQVKLLRLVQEGEYRPLGNDECKKTDARVVTATNEDIWHLQKEGRFREDLNYRLRTHHINIPPLRERKGDIPILVEHFIDESAQMLNSKRPELPEGMMEMMMSCSYPGNIRELQALVFDSVSRDRFGVLSTEVVAAHIRRQEEQARAHAAPWQFTFPGKLPTIKEVTRVLMEEAMSRCSGNMTAAAAILGISRQALSKRIQKLKEEAE